MRTRTDHSRTILIAGLGNELLRDDGVGVHAARMLQQDPPPDTIVAEIGTFVLDALHLFEEADVLIAVDAMQAGGRPGTIYSFGTSDVDDPSVKASLHELSLVGALRMLASEDRPEVVVLGVEPRVIDYGLELSQEVAAALPRLVAEIRRIVAER